MRKSFRGRHIVVILLAALLALPMVFGNSSAVGAPDDPNQIAFDYGLEHAAELGLTPDDVAEIRVTDSYESDHNRVTHVYLRQQRGGINVAQANMSSALIARATLFSSATGSLTFHPRLVPPA
ncbi:hypothetical protein BH20ACT23_BH20ACT23_06740 [soil metagenome]